MKRKNTILKWVALSMALALIIMSLPVQALERSGIGTEDSISDLPFSGLDNNGDDDVFVVEEDQAKRGQFEKHYLCSDGTYVAVTYPEAVHYLGEDHTWQDVNLSLAYDDISGLYQNEMSDFAVSFSEKASGSEMVSIENGKYFLSWGIQISSVSISDMEGDANDLHSRTSEKSMAPQADICAKVGDMPISKKYEKMSDRLVGDEDVFALPNVSSQISYTGIWGEKQKASLKYTIYHHKIEEDFIIYERGDFGSMSMNMNVGTLMPIVNGDGSVDFVDCDGIMQFHIGIPYVMDAAGSVCNDIQVNAEKKEGTCLITYTPDSSWLDSQERVFPILLDPSITTSEYVANMQDTYVEENSTANHMSEQYLYINTNGSNRRNAIIRISKLPVIDESMPIVSAKLTLTAQYASFNTVLLKAAYYDTALDLSDYQYDVLEYLPISFTAYNYLNAGATTVSFDFTPHAYEMYEDESFDMERGDIYQGDFIIGYSDSNETPFVYPFFSSGYTTASSRPVFTVKYGYTLPAGILDGGIYSFQNVASFSYMTVNGMSPANNSNIYQVYNDDGIAIMTQKFKLEYVASTGGYRLRAMSSSSGTDKVVDIQRAGGSIYSGRNVQIYSATDPISQEWLIVPVDYDVFRIVPRANMALTLTAYGYDDGTNSGKTSTSPGNIFVQTIEPHNPFQQWYIYDNDDSEINTQHFRATIDSGNYYLSNSYTGKYLHRSGNVSNCMRGTISSLGDETVKWKVVNLGDGYCTIQRSDLPGYYLAPTSNSSGSGVKLYNNSSETIPNKYKWLIRTVSGGGCLIQNKESGFYLYSLDQSSNPSSVCVYPLFSAGSTDYKKETWRVISEENYVEFGYGSSFNDIPLGIGETSRASVNRQPTRAHWASYEDFDYTIVSGGEYVSYDAGTHEFTGIGWGITQVMATHKTTGISRYFHIYDYYQSELINMFGFSYNEALLIRSLYGKVDTIYSSESTLERAWRCARVLSEFCYDNTTYGYNRWNDVAGSVTEPANIEAYFTNTLGYSSQEFITLRNAIINNHSESGNSHLMNDFAHMQYSLAARLAFTLNKDGVVSNLGAQIYTGNYGIYTDEEISYLGGWLGDAILSGFYASGTNSFENEDYMADLDAENIYRIVAQGGSAINSINVYYVQLSNQYTRADCFLQYLPYNTVKEKIFYELIDADLYLYMSYASNQGDIRTVNYYLNLINNEEYHWDQIKSNNPNTYDFLKSLHDHRATMGHYQ